MNFCVITNKYRHILYYEITGSTRESPEFMKPRLNLKTQKLCSLNTGLLLNDLSLTPLDAEVVLS